MCPNLGVELGGLLGVGSSEVMRCRASVVHIVPSSVRVLGSVGQFVKRGETDCTGDGCDLDPKSASAPVPGILLPISLRHLAQRKVFELRALFRSQLRWIPKVVCTAISHLPHERDPGSMPSVVAAPVELDVSWQCSCVRSVSPRYFA